MLRQSIEPRLIKVLSSISFEFPFGASVGDLLEYVQAREYGVALETLCDQLQEYGVPIEPALFAEIKELGTDLGIEPSYWAGLSSDS